MKVSKNRVIKAGRYIAVMCAAIMTLHCACELVGGCPYFADILVGIAVTYFIIVVTNYLGFCIMHRLGLYYALAVFGMCNYNKAIGFPPEWLPSIRWSMLTLGAILCGLIAWQHSAAAEQPHAHPCHH